MCVVLVHLKYIKFVYVSGAVLRIMKVEEGFAYLNSTVSISQSVSQSVGWSVGRSVRQSVSQSISESVSE